MAVEGGKRDALLVFYSPWWKLGLERSSGVVFKFAYFFLFENYKERAFRGVHLFSTWASTSLCCNPGV